MSRILTILIKEMRDLARDRRTMFFMVIFPAIIIPLIIGGGAKLTMFLSNKEMDRSIIVAISEQEHDKKLADYIALNESKANITIVSDIDTIFYKEKIQNGEIDAGIVIDENIIDIVESDNISQIDVYFRSGKGKNFTESRIDKILDGYLNPYIEYRYKRFNVSKNKLNPFSIDKIDIATDQEKFGKTAGTFLPYILLICCLTGVIYPALGLGVSEKERGTLETILTSPATLYELLIGKFIVVSFFGIMSVFSVLIGMLAVINLLADIPQDILDIAVMILSKKSVFLMLFLLIPVSFLFSAFMLSLSFYAKTFKEAQSIMTPMQMVVIFTVLVGTMPGISLKVSTAWIPILNVSLAMNDIISGTLSIPLYIEVLVSLLFFTGCSIWASIKFMSREEVIFRG